MAEGTEIGSLFYDLTVDDSKLQGQLDDADKGFQSFGDKLKDVGTKAALAMGAAGAGLLVFSKDATNFTEDYVKSAKALSRETGATIEDSSRLLAVTDKLGLSADQVSTYFGIFSKKINEAANNTDANRIATEKLQLQIESTQKDITATTDEIAKSGDKSGDLSLKVRTLQNNLQGLQDQLQQTSNPLDQLGISTAKADGTTKSFNDILLEVADRFHEMPDGATKTALAMDLFGRGGKDMIKVLNLGSAAIAEMEQEADRLGLTLTPNTVGKINDLIQSQKLLKEQTDAIKISVGTLTAPVLTEFNTRINEVIASILNSDGPWKDLLANSLAFGGYILSGSAALIGFIANVDQALPALIALKDALSAVAVLGFGAVAIAAVGAGAVIIDAANNAKYAWDETSAAIDSAAKSNDAVISQLKGLIKNGTPEQQARAKKTLAGLAAENSFASGVTNFEGGLAYVHQGEMLVNLPKGTDVMTKNEVKQMGGNINVNIGQVNDKSDADYILRRIDRNHKRLSMGVSPA